jgi:hypothetical protein
MPGYARCPKCRTPLPRRKQTVMGGTSVDDGGSRTGLIAVLAVLIVGAVVVAYFTFRSKDSPPPPVASPTPQQPETNQPETPEPTGPDVTETGPNQPAAPDPGVVADRLERALKRERLWSTVSVEGVRVDVRSGSCADPKLVSILDGTAASLKAAGLTRLRCLEQSGTVVSDRDL